MTFSMCGSSFDTLIADYQGSAVDALAPLSSAHANVACPGGSQLQASISHDLPVSGGSPTTSPSTASMGGTGPATGTTVLNWRAQSL